MSCMNPLIALKQPSLSEQGKFTIKIFSKNRIDEATDLKKKYGERLLYLPCGHCEACKMAYRKDWAVRCEMESFLHKENCFVTLTYDNEHCLDHPDKKELQRFFADLRDHFGIKFRYFACGELGSEKYRSHYHCIFFGYKPDDLKYYGLSKSGEDLFTSKFLESVWHRGKVWIQDFNFATASYVAGYVNKDKNQSFLMFSTRPGIGFYFMHDNIRKLFKYGHYQGKSGKTYRLPRYFDKICEKYGFDNIHIKMDNEEIMSEINKSSKFQKGLLQDVELYRSNGYTMKDKLSKLKRGL